MILSSRRRVEALGAGLVPCMNPLILVHPQAHSWPSRAVCQPAGGRSVRPTRVTWLYNRPQQLMPAAPLQLRFGVV